MDDHRVGCVFLELSRAVVEYHLRGVHQHGLHPAQLRRQLLAADGQFHGHLVPLLQVEPLLLDPVLLTDGVEGCEYLLAFHTTQTEAYLLEVAFLILGQLVEEDTLVLGNTLDFLAVIKTGEVNLRPVVEHDGVLLEAAMLRQAFDAVDGGLEVGVDGFLYGCAHLAHDELVRALPIGEYRQGTSTMTSRP